jgi:carboxypeptidase Q
MKTAKFLFAFFVLSVISLHAQIDTNFVNRIKSEAMEQSQVMATMTYLSDVIGPRLTGSKKMAAANEWTRKLLESYGLKSTVEPWGDFGRGWDLKSFHATVTAPYAFPLIAYPKAWSPATKGTVKGKIIYINEKTLENAQAKYAGKLKGATVMLGDMTSLPTLFESLAKRYSDSELLKMADDIEKDGRYANARERFRNSPGYKAYVERLKTMAWVNEQQPQLIIESGSGRGGVYNSGIVAVQGASMPIADTADIFSKKNPKAYAVDAPAIAPQIVIDAEQFNQIARIIASGSEVSFECALDVEWQTKDTKGYNTVAEWEGTDLKDQVVMAGGHLDSWHAGTGATDNAIGCAIMMEAVRILKKMDIKPRRTIRIALWSGEEQGLLGSEGYVKNHFGDKDKKTAEYDKLDVYFNLDNGGGEIRGVHMQDNEKVRALFREWLKPFRSWDASTLTLQNTGSTDHVSFDKIGLPAFQFIQDPMDYETKTHHTNMDVYDRLVPQDVERNAAIAAYFIYRAAMMDDMIPRK